MHCVLSLGLGRKKFAECSLRLLLILHNIYATGEGDLGVFWGLFLIDRDAGLNLKPRLTLHTEPVRTTGLPLSFAQH